MKLWTLALPVALLAACNATSGSDVTVTALRGALNPAVTQATIGQTICVSGWTATIRPPVSYTATVKRDMAAAAGVNVRDVVLDHIVPLEVGGAPAALANFMLQPKAESYTKDRAENEAHRRICSGQVTLKAAQRCFQLDWHACPVKP